MINSDENNQILKTVLRSLVVLFLSILILAISGYLFLYSLYNFGQAEELGQRPFRKKIIARPFAKKALRLNLVGDARFDYATDNHFSKLKILIYTQGEEKLQPETVGQVVKEIQEVVEKPGGILVEEMVIKKFLGPTIDDQELIQLTNDYPVKPDPKTKTAIVQIFVLKRFEPAPTYAGLTEDPHNIFLFMEPIQEVSDQLKTSQKVETSTILHEFGHLLGADHVEDEDCLMAEQVENLSEGLPTIIATRYCPIDLSEIKRASSL